ncbi:hypothetical protein GHT06_021615 [Daphnia sinensis]|uniref:DUF659 domain-containing protein n=1 Tax=Daphnia sinensis TaxID=1820382 RepID=A0AAD5KKM5_9CRUS|nr:hypothetical protein GHT06_021615 [Daphnia sinensis]
MLKEASQTATLAKRNFPLSGDRVAGSEEGDYWVPTLGLVEVKHPESLADFERLCKEKIKDGNNTNANASIDGGGKGNVFQNLLPLSEIEKEGFKELLGDLIGSGGFLVIKSRRSMMELLNKKYQSTKENLIAELQKAEYICITADCWTAHKRSFLGMTAHWHSEDKDSKGIVRQSACLGVRSIYGSHTHDVIDFLQSKLYNYR